MGRTLGSVSLLALVALLGGFVVGISPALACSCAEMDLARSLSEVDGAFVGTYVDRHRLGEQEATWTFEVERVIKGEFGPTAIVRTHASGASCGIEIFDDPRVGLLLEQGTDGVWQSNLCQQVAPEQLLAFADGDPPDPSIQAVDPVSGFPWWGWAIAALALTTSMVVIARSRRSSV
jgi:hypothetical protein